MTGKKPKVWAGMLFVCLLGIWTIWLFQRGDRGLPDIPISDEVNRYLAMEFLPRYSVRDCVIRYEVILQEDAGNFIRNMGNAFSKYINEHEPHIGMMAYYPLAWPNYDLYFADQCDRKDEIFAGMAAYVERYFGHQFSVNQVPAVDFEFLDMRRHGSMKLWLDSHDYDPEYWPTLHLAARGNGEAFLRLAEFYDDDLARHLYYALAEHYLPGGALRIEAKRLKEELQSNLSSERLKRQNDAFQDWVSKIDLYNIGK